MYDAQFGNEKINLLNPKNIIEIIDSNSNIFIVKFEANNSGNNILGYYDATINSMIQSVIKSIEIPAVGFEDDSYKRGGYTYHDAGEINIGDCTITTYNDLNSYVYSFWHKWYDAIIRGKLNNENKLSVTDNFNMFSSNVKDNYRLFPDEYKLNIKIWKLFRTDNDKMHEIILYGCYPSSLSYGNLSWDNTDTIPEFNIELKVDRMYVNIFSTEIMKYNLSGYNSTLKNITNQKINLDAYKNVELKNINNTLNFTKNSIKEKFKNFQGNLKAKLSNSEQIIINNVKERLRAEITKRLPADLRNLDYFNIDNFINQILSKAETWVIKKIHNAGDLITIGNIKRGGGSGKIIWDVESAIPIDMELLINKILANWDDIINTTPSKEILIEKLRNWEPGIAKPKEPTAKSFNGYTISYEEFIIKSENAKNEILKGD